MKKYKFEIEVVGTISGLKGKFKATGVVYGANHADAIIRLKNRYVEEEANQIVKLVLIAEGQEDSFDFLSD